MSPSPLRLRRSRKRRKTTEPDSILNFDAAVRRGVFCGLFWNSEALLTSASVVPPFTLFELSRSRQNRFLGKQCEEWHLCRRCGKARSGFQEGSQRDRIAQFGDLAVPVEFFLKPFGECLLCFVLAVDQYDLLGVLFAAPEPQQEFAGVGVGRKTGDP